MLTAFYNSKVKGRFVVEAAEEPSVYCTDVFWQFFKNSDSSPA